MNYTELEVCQASCLLCSLVRGSKSEPILLSKFCLIMHSSFLLRPLQPCLYPPLILPSVGQEPAATHCSLYLVSHIAAQLSLSVFLWATVSPSLSLSLHHSLFMSSNCTNKMGESSVFWPWFLWVVYGGVHAWLYCNCVKKWHVIMGISICCQIGFFPSLSLLAPPAQGHLFFTMMWEFVRMWRMSRAMG